ncbi:MAG: hypothetical protein M1838_003592 [Thelocarpon superellum]|nr:MAG: hypothetical protein M1838_003592 [Thelocarpon superellum]
MAVAAKPTKGTLSKPTETVVVAEPAPAPTDAGTPPSGSDPAADFQGDVAVSTALPAAADVGKAEDLIVLDAEGNSHPFKSLYNGPDVASRVLVVFIRHFFCGMCQEFLRTLTDEITPESLGALPTPASIVVVGCGRPELIPMYARETRSPFPIYADPTRKLYEIFGMTTTLKPGQKKPNYIRQSTIQGMIGGIVQSLKAGTYALKGGDYRQIGGEFVFDQGQVVWCHRMRNTRDHAEIPEIRKVLGFVDPAAAAEADTATPSTAPAPTPTPAPSSATETAPAATPAATPVTNKRRSLVMGRVMNRMSGDWGRKVDAKFLQRSASVQEGKRAAVANGATTEPSRNVEESATGRAESSKATNGHAVPAKTVEPETTPDANASATADVEGPAVPATMESTLPTVRKVEEEGPKVVETA